MPSLYMAPNTPGWGGGSEALFSPRSPPSEPYSPAYSPNPASPSPYTGFFASPRHAGQDASPESPYSSQYATLYSPSHVGGDPSLDEMDIGTAHLTSQNTKVNKGECESKEVGVDMGQDDYSDVGDGVPLMLPAKLQRQSSITSEDGWERNLSLLSSECTSLDRFIALARALR